MKIARTARFKKAWEQLTTSEKLAVKKAIVNMMNDLRYPSLRTKKMQGGEDMWEARASRSLRITFLISGDTIVLRNVGHHDDTLGNP